VRLCEYQPISTYPIVCPHKETDLKSPRRVLRNCASCCVRGTRTQDFHAPFKEHYCTKSVQVSPVCLAVLSVASPGFARHHSHPLLRNSACGLSSTRPPFSLESASGRLRCLNNDGRPLPCSAMLCHAVMRQCDNARQ
jgi:hypothetical protein